MAKKKDGSPGNSSMDQKWIQEHADSLVRLNDGEYAGYLVWNGKQEYYGSAWTIPTDGARCTAYSYIRDEDGQYVLDSTGARLRRPCYHWRMKGTHVCLNHGGGIPDVRRKAKNRLLLFADRITGELYKIATDEKVPPKERIMASNSILDRCGITGKTEVEITTPAYTRVWEEMMNDTDEPDSGDEND